MVPGLVTLHQMVEVPPSVEHRQLPDELADQADEEAGVGEEAETSFESGEEIVDDDILQPGDQHGGPVLDTVVHQEAVEAEVLRVGESRGDVLSEVEGGEDHQVQTKRAVPVGETNEEDQAQAVGSHTEIFLMSNK